MNQTNIHVAAGSIWPPSVGWGSSVAVSCGVGRRRGSDPSLLWLWLWPAADLTPSLGTSICHCRYGPKKKKKEKERKKERKEEKKKETVSESRRRNLWHLNFPWYHSVPPSLATDLKTRTHVPDTSTQYSKNYS